MELLVVPADTILRSAPHTLTRDNFPQFMERGRIGMGGTEFRQPLAQAAQLAVFQEQNIKTILYFSDLLAAPPKSRKDCGLKEDVQVIFVFGGDDFNEHKWAGFVRIACWYCHKLLI